MKKVNFFPKEQIIGVFRGFTEAGMEFHADLTLPYRNDFQNVPMHGQFLLVQLETSDEAVLGRITSFSSEGRLSYGVGEEYNIRAIQEDRAVPDDLREQYLRYRVNIRVLGVLRNNGDKVVMVPSHRRLPHVGSPVAFPSDELLQELAGHNDAGTPIGFFALGEYVFSGENGDLTREDWMQVKEPEILIKFAVRHLVSRRSFLFARAGFGKSNLNKLLFSQLYKKTPTVEKRGGRQVPVGTLLFDPEGEYFWPDDKGRPGLCDVPELENQIVVFTSRGTQSGFYRSFVAGGIKLDIRRFKPSDVISIALPPEQQDQQNVRKLKGLSPNNWEQLVNLIDEHGNNASTETIGELMNLDKDRQQFEAIAARSNMTTIIQSLHDRHSQLMDMLLSALEDGKLCIIDISQMRQRQSLILSGLILRRIFDRNQEEFTAVEPKTIPTIAVVEEAQSVLNAKATGAEPYITWVKEGRKYDLGAFLITQQPGSIPHELLSQGDNWFLFHLLSAGDLKNVQSANAHFSQDVLSSLLNEPIVGQGVFWSSVGKRPFPIYFRALLFEAMYKSLDPEYRRPMVRNYAQELKEKFAFSLGKAVSEVDSGGSGMDTDGDEIDRADPIEVYTQRAIQQVREKCPDVFTSIEKDGYAYGGLKHILKQELPESLDNVDGIAYNLVPKMLDYIYGAQGTNWHSFKAASGATWVKTGPKPGD